MSKIKWISFSMPPEIEGIIRDEVKRIAREMPGSTPTISAAVRNLIMRGARTLGRDTA